MSQIRNIPFGHSADATLPLCSGPPVLSVSAPPRTKTLSELRPQDQAHSFNMTFLCCAIRRWAVIAPLCSISQSRSDTLGERGLSCWSRQYKAPTMAGALKGHIIAGSVIHSASASELVSERVQYMHLEMLEFMKVVYIRFLFAVLLSYCVQQLLWARISHFH